MILDKYPTFAYRFADDDYKRIVNFTVGMVIERMNIHNKLLFKPVNIYENDTPESVAENVYGDSSLFWVILLTNTIVNPFQQWIKPTRVIRDEFKKNDTIEFFIDVRNGKIVDDVDHERYMEMRQNNTPLPEYINSYTRSQYEMKLNERRNEIWIISPSYIYEFVDEFESLLSMNISKGII